MALAPAAAALAIEAFVVVAYGPFDGIRDVADPLVLLSFWVPLAAHAPLFIGAGLYFARGTGGPWLRAAPWPVAAFVGFLAWQPAMFLLLWPLLAGALVAWLAGRRLGAASEDGMPALPETPR